jgi:hypothetical protein
MTEWDRSGVATHVSRAQLTLDEDTQRLEEHVQPLLDNHPPDLAGEQDLLVHERVGVVGLDAARAEGVELLQHENKQLPLGREVVRANVDEDVAAQEQRADFGVAQTRGRAQRRPEERAKEGEALRFRCSSAQAAGGTRGIGLRRR